MRAFPRPPPACPGGSCPDYSSSPLFLLLSPGCSVTIRGSYSVHRRVPRPREHCLKVLHLSCTGPNERGSRREVLRTSDVPDWGPSVAFDLWEIVDQIESAENRPRMGGSERRPQPSHFLPRASFSFLLGTKQLSTYSLWLTARMVAKTPVGHCPPLYVTPHQSQHRAVHSSLQGFLPALTSISISTAWTVTATQECSEAKF